MARRMAGVAVSFPAGRGCGGAAVWACPSLACGGGASLAGAGRVMPSTGGAFGGGQGLHRAGLPSPGRAPVQSPELASPAARAPARLSGLLPAACASTAPLRSSIVRSSGRSGLIGGKVDPPARAAYRRRPCRAPNWINLTARSEVGAPEIFGGLFWQASLRPRTVAVPSCWSDEDQSVPAFTEPSFNILLNDLWST